MFIMRLQIRFQIALIIEQIIILLVVKRVNTPRLRHINETWILFAQLNVVPKIIRPRGYEKKR